MNSAIEKLSAYNTQNYIVQEIPLVQRNIPIYIFDLSGLLKVKQYVDFAYAYRNQFTESNKTHVKGWHSDYKSHKNISDQRLLQLMSLIEQKVDTVVNQYGNTNIKSKIHDIWINILNKGDSVENHNHAVYGWSAVYYVKTKDYMKPITFEGKTVIVPKDNMLIVFPGHIFHSVDTLDTEEDRISIAANLFLHGTKEVDKTQ